MRRLSLLCAVALGCAAEEPPERESVREQQFGFRPLTEERKAEYELRAARRSPECREDRVFSSLADHGFILSMHDCREGLQTGCAVYCPPGTWEFEEADHPNPRSMRRAYKRSPYGRWDRHR